MPNTASHPSASNERTRDCAPLTRTGAPTGGAGLGGCVGVGIGMDTSLGVAVVMVLPYFHRLLSRLHSPGHQKTLAARSGSSEGWRVDVCDSSDDEIGRASCRERV